MLVETMDIRSNIPLRLKEFLRPKPEGTPEGKGVCLTIYPGSSANTDSISFKLDGVGSIDNRPSTDKLHHIVKKQTKKQTFDM